MPGQFVRVAFRARVRVLADPDRAAHRARVMAMASD
jgi:hypothetical protein